MRRLVSFVWMDRLSETAQPNHSFPVTALGFLVPGLAALTYSSPTPYKQTGFVYVRTVDGVGWHLPLLFDKCCSIAIRHHWAIWEIDINIELHSEQSLLIE